MQLNFPPPNTSTTTAFALYLWRAWPTTSRSMVSVLPLAHCSAFPSCVTPAFSRPFPAAPTGAPGPLQAPSMVASRLTLSLPYRHHDPSIPHLLETTPLPPRDDVDAKPKPSTPVNHAQVPSAGGSRRRPMLKLTSLGLPTASLAQHHFFYIHDPQGTQSVTSNFE